MKNLFLFLALFLLCNFVNAQQASGDGSAAKSTSTKEATSDPPKGGKVIVPPEKARPISIPKLATAITIDGRPDEEAWKTAAVFNDFYQTGPGYNTAPS